MSLAGMEEASWLRVQSLGIGTGRAPEGIGLPLRAVCSRGIHSNGLVRH